MSLRCSVYIAVSLDGYIARKDDRLDWLDRVQREGEDYASGPLSEIVKRYEGRAYVDGGETVRSSLKEGLVDDLTLSVVPIILGSGIPLFASGLPELSLELAESRSFPSGLVQSRYRVKPQDSDEVPVRTLAQSRRSLRGSVACLGAQSRFSSAYSCRS